MGGSTGSYSNGGMQQGYGGYSSGGYGGQQSSGYGNGGYQPGMNSGGYQPIMNSSGYVQSGQYGGMNGGFGQQQQGWQPWGNSMYSGNQWPQFGGMQYGGQRGFPGMGVRQGGPQTNGGYQGGSMPGYGAVGIGQDAPYQHPMTYQSGMNLGMQAGGNMGVGNTPGQGVQQGYGGFTPGSNPGGPSMVPQTDNIGASPPGVSQINGQMDYSNGGYQTPGFVPPGVQQGDTGLDGGADPMSTWRAQLMGRV